MFQLILFSFISAIIQLPQHHFPQSVPPGNYSGITWLGGNRYAVVSDKSDADGFFVFRIDVDSVTGEITNAVSEGFKSSGKPNRDGEGIAYNPYTNTVFISGEADNTIREYDIDGHLTGRNIPPAPVYSHLPSNLGLEALDYNPSTKMLWTCNESDTVYIQGYDSLLVPRQTYTYLLDKPIADKSKAQFYAHGIGTIISLDDGSFLIQEREFYVPHKKLGAFVNCKLYGFNNPQTSNFNPQSKTLLAQWKTSLGLFDRSIANYEGMCLGPTLADGSRLILLVADSQNQYRGVLRDWLKTLRVTFQQP